MDFHDQMRAFDARRGKSVTFDPTKIEGAEMATMTDVPPIEAPEVPTAAGIFGSPIEPELPPGNPGEPASSPLVDMGLRSFLDNTPPSRLGNQQAAPIKEAELWVSDDQARLRGHLIPLSAEARKKIETILVREARNGMDRLYKQLTGTTARAPRKKGSRKKPAAA